MIGNAVRVMQTATGETHEENEDGKGKTAQAMAPKGRTARASKPSPEQRREIAKKAAAKRWAK